MQVDIYRVYLSRNLVNRRVGRDFPIAAVLPLFDMSFLWLNGQTPPAVHPVALVLLAASAALLWRRARGARI
jgi:hypothetical protein